MMRAPSAACVLLGLCVLTIPPGAAKAANDYPTDAVVDYVLGCMRTNGQTREALEHCSCSFDVLSSVLTYDQYVRAETVRRMAQVSGEMGTVFRNNAMAKSVTDNLRRAQAEAELRCF